MKRQLRDRPRGGRPPGRRPRAADEGGFLLVMVMVVMLVLSAVVASTLINSFLERSLAKNQNYASVALQSAEGGIAAGMTWLRENQNDLPSPYTTDPNWSTALAGGFTRDVNGDGDTLDAGEAGGNYAVTLRFKREWRDVNGDGDCTDPGETTPYHDGDPGGDGVVGTADDPSQATVCPGDIVLYNRCSGADGCFDFPDAMYLNAGEGYPVIEIDSVGTYGSGSFREIAMDIARNKIDIQVEGAITARGPITQSGSGYADGHNYNEAGTALSGSCGNLPSVTVDAGLAAPPCDPANDPTAAPGDPNPKGLFGGTPCTKVYDPTAPGKRALGTTPWDVLGLPESVFRDLFTPRTDITALSGTAAEPTYVWQAADLHVTGGSGFGILVIHNESYVPDTWEAQCPSGVTGAGYCVAGNAPATFYMNGNVTYTGVIIADQIMRVNGTAATTGAIISLGGVNVSGDITGNWTAKYSCDAVEKALGGFGYGTKISWHRLR